MRWIAFLILTYILLLVQTTVGQVLLWHSDSIGAIGPDLLAIAAVFLALHVRTGAEAMLAGWILGFSLDLTAGGGAAGTVVGPMAVAYSLGCLAVHRVREAFFRDRPLPQALLTLAFAAFVQAFWVTVQALRSGGISWDGYGTMLLQALAIAGYTALLAPLVCFILGRMRRWLLASPSSPARR